MLPGRARNSRPHAQLMLLAISILPVAALACSSSNNNKSNAATQAAATRAAVATTAATPARTAAAGSPRAGSPAASKPLPPGGTDDPKSLTMAFVPSRDVAAIQLSADKIATYLTKELKRPVKSVTLANYSAVTQALTAKTADIGWVGPLDYLIAHEQNASYPVTCSLRNGGIPGYKAFIITKTDSGINTLADLKNKSFAFGDVTSTSSNLVPKGAMMKAGIDPSKDLKAVNISNQSAIAIAVYEGKADAGAIYDDARTNKEVADKYPDILQKTKAIYTSDLIPCDPQIVRKDLTSALAGNIRSALLKYSSDPEGKTVLKDLFSIEALGAISDSDYDGLRQTVKAVAPDLLKNTPPTAAPAGGTAGTPVSTPAARPSATPAVGVSPRPTP